MQLVLIFVDYSSPPTPSLVFFHLQYSVHLPVTLLQLPFSTSFLLLPFLSSSCTFHCLHPHSHSYMCVCEVCACTYVYRYALKFRTAYLHMRGYTAFVFWIWALLVNINSRSVYFREFSLFHFSSQCNKFLCLYTHIFIKNSYADKNLNWFCFFDIMKTRNKQGCIYVSVVEMQSCMCILNNSIARSYGISYY